MGALTEFLFPAPARRSAKSIVGWWERRRLPYNLAVGAAGIASIAWIYVAETFAPGGGFPGPLPWQPLVAFGVLANFCYLLGPATEILIEKLGRGQILPTGPTLYRMGLTFSVGLALLPGLIMTISLAVRVVLAVVGVI